MKKTFWMALFFCYLVLLLFFTGMGITSYFAYSTAGVDFEEPTQTGVDVTYYRLRWDDGSTWIGMAIQPVPRPDRPLDWFDPGGTLLHRPTMPAHKTWLEKSGFWFISSPEQDPFMEVRYRGATTSYWIGIPSWLFLLLIWSPFCWRISREFPRKKQKQAPAPTEKNPS